MEFFLDFRYLVTNQQQSTATQWWNSDKDEATYIDFTKPAAATWFSSRLTKLMEDTVLRN